MKRRRKIGRFTDGIPGGLQNPALQPGATCPYCGGALTAADAVLDIDGESYAHRHCWQRYNGQKWGGK